MDKRLERRGGELKRLLLISACLVPVGGFLYAGGFSIGMLLMLSPLVVVAGYLLRLIHKSPAAAVLFWLAVSLLVPVVGILVAGALLVNWGNKKYREAVPESEREKDIVLPDGKSQAGVLGFQVED